MIFPGCFTWLDLLWWLDVEQLLVRGSLCVVVQVAPSMNVSPLLCIPRDLWRGSLLKPLASKLMRYVYMFDVSEGS